MLSYEDEHDNELTGKFLCTLELNLDFLSTQEPDFLDNSLKPLFLDKLQYISISSRILISFQHRDRS